jgi:hypothetical protein
MKNMNVLIISLNFNPGHFSHLIANYKLFEESGLKAHLYLNKSFNTMDEKNEFRKINDSRELRKMKTISAAVFWFPSLKNITEIIRLRLFYKTQIIYIYHEPFDSIKKYYNSGFGFKKILKICLIFLVSIPVVLLAHKIVLPSLTSLALYEKKYTILNKNYTHISLIFDDELDLAVVPPKKFISYIGTVAADHAFDRFVEFAEVAIKNSWFPGMSFLIATSSEIPQRQSEILSHLKQTQRLVISSSKPMNNSEINHYYLQSQVVWNAYNRSMQSGVLPKAYMFGAAVLVLRRNTNEFMDNYGTGVLISDNKNQDEIRIAIEEIIAKKDYYFKNCRKKFFEKFYYKNKIENYLMLLSNKKSEIIKL